MTAWYDLMDGVRRIAEVDLKVSVTPMELTRGVEYATREVKRKIESELRAHNTLDIVSILVVTRDSNE